MIAGAQVAAKAREYLHTRFRHQGRQKGVGIDCAGLIVCVARELRLPVTDVSAYPRLPDVQRFRAALDASLDRVGQAEPQAGDIVWMDFDGSLHLAIVDRSRGEPYLIHAAARFRAVVEHRLDDTWRARVRGVYRYRGLAPDSGARGQA